MERKNACGSIQVHARLVKRGPQQRIARDSTNLLIADTTLQRALSFCGGQYKKIMAQSKLQQVTFPVDEKAGLDVVNKFFGEIIPADERPDISKVPGGKAFMEAAWLIGCSSDLKQINFTPNNAALLKMLVVGKVRHILIEWQSLVAAFKKTHPGEELSAETALDKLSMVDDESLTAEILFKHGATMRQCVLNKLEVMFIPMGWLRVEISGHISPLFMTSESLALWRGRFANTKMQYIATKRQKRVWKGWKPSSKSSRSWKPRVSRVSQWARATTAQQWLSGYKRFSCRLVG